MSAPAIVIDDEFSALIPPLSDLEKAQLEISIIDEGCRDPLVVWKNTGILIDGHNRYEICERNSIDFSIVELPFESREKAMDWMDKNQLGRRNLNPDQASLIRGRIYNRVKKPHGTRGKKTDQNDQSFQGTAGNLAKEHGVSTPTIRRDGQYATAVESLGIEAEVTRGTIDAPKSAVVEAAKALPKDATPAQKTEAVEKLKTAHVSHNSGNNEWYTPAEFCESACVVMGRIDLDPASCKVANKQVKANRFFTAEQDALKKQWKGRIWLNPPYGQPLIADFAKKFIDEINAGNIEQAIVLVNNATETAWSQLLISNANAACFKAGRIKFLDASGKPANTPLQGQVFLYFGDEVQKFIEEFQQYGACLT